MKGGWVEIWRPGTGCFYGKWRNHSDQKASGMRPSPGLTAITSPRTVTCGRGHWIIELWHLQVAMGELHLCISLPGCHDSSGRVCDLILRGVIINDVAKYFSSQDSSHEKQLAMCHHTLMHSLFTASMHAVLHVTLTWLHPQPFPD